jgi:hypothetical protein
VGDGVDMNDPLSAALAPIREMIGTRDALIDRMRTTAVGVLEFNKVQDGLADHTPALLAAVDKVLALHAPRSDRVLGSSCFTHRTALNTMLPVPGCKECVQDRQREVCPECRDEYGDPVLFQDCRARAAVLAELTGKEADHA